MDRRRTLRLVFCVAVAWVWALCVASPEAWAQSSWPDYPQVSAGDPHAIDRGPGNYLAWYKLLGIAVVFLIWVCLADRVNRDAITWEDKTELPAQLWNPLVIGAFLVGFLAVITIPVFWIGAAVYVLAAFGMPLTYALLRRKRHTTDSTTEVEVEHVSRLQAEQLASVRVQLRPSEGTDEQQQANLIRARQSNGFLPLALMIADMRHRRADLVLMDYTRDAVAVAMQVDGAWHNVMNFDRPTGDTVLESLKSLANLDPRERRQRQMGRFLALADKTATRMQVTTQGVPTGERVMIKALEDKTRPLSLGAMGMSPDIQARLIEATRNPGCIIVTAAPGQGLTALWRALLAGADRFTRDWIAVVDHDELDTDMENIELSRYDSRAGQHVSDNLRSLLLRQPDVLVVPKLGDPQSADTVLAHVINNDRTLLTRATAPSAVEGLAQVAAGVGKRTNLARALRFVVCQRLVRRLCPACKQPMPVSDESIRKLGGTPGTVIYTHWQRPPPEELVDEKGKPIEPPICGECGGVGYKGRIGVFELLVADDQVRAAVVQDPRPETLLAAARRGGHVTLVRAAYNFVLSGVTSVAEIQRVFKSG